MSNLRRGLLFLVLIITFSHLAKAQETALYTLKNAPQSLRINTSYYPKYRWFISIPALSAINVGVSNSAFSMSELFPSNPDGSLSLGLDSIADNMGNRAVFNFNTSVEIINLGVKVDRNKFMYLNIQEVIDLQFAYNRDLLSLLAYGNAHESNLGEEILINKLGAKLNHYTKIGFGWLWPNRAGTYYTIRPNLLFGKGHLNSQRTFLNITTADDLSSIQAKGDLIIQSAGLPRFGDIMAGNPISFNAGQYFTNFFANPGFALDFGMQRNISKTQSININIIDLGGILWSKDAYSVNTSGIDFKFDGLDLSALSGGSGEVEIDENGDTIPQGNFFDSLLTTLDSQLNLVSGEAPFFAPISPKIYLGTTFFINDYMDFDIFFRAQMKSSYFHQSLTISPNFHTKSGFGLTVAYSVIGSSFDNLGFGITFNAGPIQVYFVGDNVYGFSQIDYAKHMNFILGFNVMPKGRRTGAFQKSVRSRNGRQF